MALGVLQSRLPLVRDLGLVFRLSDVTTTLLIASSIAGIAYGPRGWWYDPNPATLPAFLGQDVVTLLFAVPLLAGSSFAARRGSLRGVLCWMGAFFYVAYSYYFYVVGGRFNAFFPLYIAIVSMGAYGALAVLFSLDVPRLPAYVDRAPLRELSVFFIVTALAFAGLWLSKIDTHLRLGTELDPVARAVIAVDGVVLLPLLFYGGQAIRRRDPLGYALAGLLLVKVTATFLTLLVNTTIAVRWGQATDNLQTVAYSVGLIASATLLVRFFERVRNEARTSVQRGPAYDRAGL